MKAKEGKAGCGFNLEKEGKL